MSRTIRTLPLRKHPWQRKPKVMGKLREGALKMRVHKNENAGLHEMWQTRQIWNNRATDPRAEQL